MRTLYLLSAVCLLIPLVTTAQDSLSLKAQQLTDKYFSQVQHKSRQYENLVNKRAEKALNRLARQERKMQAKLAKIDAIAAENIFARSIDSLGSLKRRLNNKAGRYTQLLHGSYNGYLDTLQGSLEFLEQSRGLLSKSQELQSKARNSLKTVQQLKGKLQQAEQIRTYIRERKQQLKSQLAQYTGFTKNLQKINKEAYYYGQQLAEYKSLLKDRRKAEEKAQELLRKIPACNDFLQKHSQLAGLFNLRGTGTSDVAQSLEGLQTRVQVEQLIQQRLGSGPDARAAVSRQMEQARAQFNELKSKFPDLDNAADMPDFKPNEMETKRFIQRLEFGGNLQFQRASSWYPTTSDIAGQVAYKFSKNGSAGLGVTYKLGLGKNISSIAFSNQGVGFRSFVDYKLKGTFFVNGGFEQNYNTGFEQVQELRNWDKWQGSALIGISKKYKINSKLKGNVMLLYDFLYNKHFPRTDPVKLRMGYSF